MRSRRLGGIAVSAMCAMGVALAPAAADEPRGERVRVATERLDLTIALDGAVPVRWRACHPTCALVDAGSGTSVRFVDDGDPSVIRLRLRDSEPAVDLQRLRFTVELAEDERARIATFQSDLPVEGARLVTSFALSREGYEVVMTIRNQQLFPGP